MDKCVACELVHREVESKGFCYCPNPLCGGIGSVWFRFMLDSYRKDDNQHVVDSSEWVEKALEYLETAETTIKEAGMRSLERLERRHSRVVAESEKEKGVEAERLNTARERVLSLMGDGEWHKAHEIADPEVGGSEGLRRLRELRAAGHSVEKRKYTEGTWEYRLGYASPEDDLVTGRATLEQAAAFVALTLEILEKQPQKLVWGVDLRKDLGEPDIKEDPDGYEDGRWTDVLGNLRKALYAQQGGEQSVTPFGLIVVCKGGMVENEPRPLRVTLSTEHMVDMGKWLNTTPPVGKWLVLSSEQEQARTEGEIPSMYFIDGVPF